MKAEDGSSQPSVIRTRRKTIVARSPTQVRYIEALGQADIIFALGPAGTGKTYLAVAQAVSPQATGGALRRVLEIALDGYGRFPSAKTTAGRHLQRHGGSESAAIQSLIDVHVRLASAQGFVTNLGGIVAMPVAVPANLAGVAVLQVRMVGAIAHLRGYDLNDSRVRTALVMCLLGGEGIGSRVARGVLPTSPMAVATAPVFDPDLDRRVAEEVMGDLVARIGGKNVALMVTKRVPLLGGGIGAVIDGIATHQIGTFTKGELVARRRLMR